MVNKHIIYSPKQDARRNFIESIPSRASLDIDKLNFYELKDLSLPMEKNHGFFEQNLFREFVDSFPFSPNERQVVTALMARMVRWGKSVEMISQDFFLSGDSLAHAGANDYPAAGISKNTLLKTLKALEEKNIIKRRQVKIPRDSRSATFIIFNFMVWFDDIIGFMDESADDYAPTRGRIIKQREEDMGRLKQPKREKAEFKNRTLLKGQSSKFVPCLGGQSSKFEPPYNNTGRNTIIQAEEENNTLLRSEESSEDTAQKEIKNLNQENFSSLNNTSFENKKNLGKIVSETKQKTQQARDRKLEKAKSKKTKITPSDVEKVWLSTFREVYGNTVTSFTMKEKGQIKNMLKSTEVEGGSFLDLTEWFVRDWLMIRATNTRNMSLPDWPTVGIFAGYKTMVLRLWMRRKELEELKVCSKVDQIARHYSKLGYSYEDAKEMAYKESEAYKLTAKAKKKLQELDEREKMLDARKNFTPVTVEQFNQNAANAIDYLKEQRAFQEEKKNKFFTGRNYYEED